jgi:catechol 2,3-dioxygenase-like lactoylglutathione lyase family enzyme
MKPPSTTKRSTMGKLRHIAIQCEDHDATAEFFKEVFGMEELYRIGNPESKGGAIYLSDGTINLALLKIVDPEFPNYRPVGLNHIGFIVEDLEETVAKAKSHGGQTTLAGDQIVPGQLWEFKMETPEGVGLDIYDVNGRGWPGVSGLEDLGIEGTSTVDGHKGQHALAGGPATTGKETT